MNYQEIEIRIPKENNENATSATELYRESVSTQRAKLSFISQFNGTISFSGALSLIIPVLLLASRVYFQANENA